MRSSTLFLVGVIAFVGFAITQAPARHLYGWLAPAANLYPQARGLSGTLGTGSVEQLILNPLGGAVGDLDWHLEAWKLLLARASFRISGGDGGLLIDGIAAATPLGTVRLDDLRISSPLKRLASAAGYGFVPVEASIGADISTLRLRDGWPSSVDGSIQIDRLSWNLGKNATALGTYQVRLEDDAGAIRGTVSTLSGPLQAEGGVELKPDRTWTLDLKVKAEAAAPSAVVNLASSLGQPDSQGWYRVQRQGTAALGAP